MPNPTRIEINCETGVESIIELTDAEVAELEKQAAKMDTIRAEQEATLAALATLKASAKAKLVAGEPLTEEEAATIVL
jgi:5-bromo-4-chloroindolyl phosphate hydrolysis protein